MADKLVGAAEAQALASIKAALARKREENISRFGRQEAATRRTGGGGGRGGPEYRHGGGGGRPYPAQLSRSTRTWGPRPPPGGPGDDGFHAPHYGPGAGGYGAGPYQDGGGYGAGPHPGGDGYGHDLYYGEAEEHMAPQHDGYGRASYGGNGWGQGGF